MGKELTEKQKNAMEIMEANRESLKEMIPLFNGAALIGDMKTVASLSDKMDDLEGKYNEQAKVYAFEELVNGNKSTNVLKDAALMLRYDCIRVTEKKDPKTKILERSLSDVTRPIDPLDVQKHAGVPIAPNKDWQYAVERFNFRLTLRLAKKLGMSDKEISKINDSYAMNKLNESYRKSVNEEKDEKGNPIANPVSNSQMIKEMQAIVDMCIGTGYKVTSHDVEFLIACYGKKDNKKGLSITASTHKQLRMAFMDIMNNIMCYTEKVSGYTVSYKVKKDDAPKSNDNKPFTPTGTTATTEKAPEKDTHKLKTEEKPTKGKSTKAKAEKPKAEEPKKEEKKI